MPPDTTRETGCTWITCIFLINDLQSISGCRLCYTEVFRSTERNQFTGREGKRNVLCPFWLLVDHRLHQLCVSMTQRRIGRKKMMFEVRRGHPVLREIMKWNKSESWTKNLTMVNWSSIRIGFSLFLKYYCQILGKNETTQVQNVYNKSLRSHLNRIHGTHETLAMVSVEHLIFLCFICWINFLDCWFQTSFETNGRIGYDSTIFSRMVLLLLILSDSFWKAFMAIIFRIWSILSVWINFPDHPNRREICK